MKPGLLDELRRDMHSNIAGEGTRLFEGPLKSYPLELVSTIPFIIGIVGLAYCRPD